MRTRLQRTLAITALAIAAQVGFQASAMAQVSFNIQVGPPSPIYEQVPVMPAGYVWAPGYWAWHGDRHIWVHGRSMVQRVGYRWQPDAWEQRNNQYYRNPGRWERDTGYRAPPPMHAPRAMEQRYDGPGKSRERGNSGKHRKDDKHDRRN